MIRALLALLALAASASADVIQLPRTKTTIDLPRAWKPVEQTGVVLGATGPAGEILAITRAQVPNPDAWRAKTRDAYADEIERGVASRIAGYQRLARKLALTREVPTLDLEAKRADGATIFVRVLLYRTYALALAIEVPKRATSAAARGVLATFAPP